MWTMSVNGSDRVVLGLDLGQRQDWTALAAVATAWEREPVTGQQPRQAGREGCARLSAGWERSGSRRADSVRRRFC